MDKSEITQGVKEVIAINSRFAIDEIGNNDPLDKFISASMSARLARETKRRFNKIKSTELTNKLYVSIKKVKDLIDYVSEYYQDEEA